AILVAATHAAAAAQFVAPALPAPATILDRFHLHAGTVQNLALPLRSAVPFSVDVRLEGVDRRLFLTPYDVRTADFQLLLDDGISIRRLPTPESVTFRGTVGGLAGAEVAASLVAGQLHATIHGTGGLLWAIEPLTVHDRSMPRETHIVYRARDVRARDVHCGVHATPAHDDTDQTPRIGTAALRVAEMAVDADVRYYQLYNNDPVAVNARVATVINACNVIYRRDCEIEYALTTVLVRTTNVYSWNGDLCNLLSQFRSRWNNNHGSIRRDLAHLFTGEGTFSGVVGCANVGVVCTSSAYGASKVYAGNLATDVGLVAHETGHNWNAPHCDSQSTCNIMCSGLGGCGGNLGSFAPSSVSRIVAHRNSRTCLGNPVAPTLTAIAPDTVPSWGPPQVELTGTDMSSVTSVTVGGQPVNFTLTSPTTIRFTPRAPFLIGTHPVVVSNSVGSSAPLQLRVVGNHPSALELSTLLVRNFPLPLTMHSDAGWVGLPLMSLSGSPSTAPGIVDLGIGNGFTDLIQLPFLVAGANGAATLPIAMPPEMPAGIYVYTQLVTFDAANLAPPLEASNVVRSEVR
ncbi:MAG TPA: M12 family metallo-peptidase, partial [Planctomycetota bacterium]|nr:M12 family metallo-peptidase [Planctomycetota bacterium]